MGNMLAATIRFREGGMEGELYRKIQEGKDKTGLSTSEYVKKILSEYFAGEEKRSEAEKVLQEIREEHRDMVRRVEKIIQNGMREHDAVLLGALSRIGGTAVISGINNGMEDKAELPKESGDIPEGTLDFLDSL